MALEAERYFGKPLPGEEMSLDQDEAVSDDLP